MQRPTPLSGQSKIILDFGFVYMISVLHLADQNLAEGPCGFWILDFAIFAKLGFFPVCRGIENRLALRAWNTCIIFCRFCFPSERPEVHEKDADSFMAFIKRWLFCGAFCGVFGPVWKIHVPAGLALHPGSGVWNFSDWFWEMNGLEFAGTMPSHKCDLATKCYWMTDNKLSRGRLMLIYWFSRDVFSFSHHFFYIIAKTSKDGNFCSGRFRWVGLSDFLVWGSGLWRTNPSCGCQLILPILKYLGSYT